MTSAAEQEGRLGLDDVSGEISRLFFKQNAQSGRPSYSDSYGPPQGPVIGQDSVFTPSLYQGI